MAFSNLPIVDVSAKASEESVLFVRSIFSTKNGFICREESPDYGCDLELEIITNGQHASGKKVPVQIKSWQKCKIIEIDSEHFVSKAFKTSRLAYLCQRHPAYGIILIYDEPNKICYFDFVEDIVKRLDSERFDDNWRNQETVNIHIPTNNILSFETASTIHSRLINRFEAHVALVSSHGAQFHIPNLQSNINITTGELLGKYGLMLISSHEIANFHILLRGLAHSEILSSKELVLLSCIVHSQIGQTIDADYFLQKAFQKLEQFDKNEQEILRFVRIKVNFLLGREENNYYISQLSELASSTENEVNKLQLEINILTFKLVQQLSIDDLDDQIERDIFHVFKRLNSLSIDEESKILLKVFQAENLNMYASSLLIKQVRQIKLKEALGIFISKDERYQIYKKINRLIETSVLNVLEAKTFASKHDNSLVMASALYALSFFFLTREFDFLVLKHEDNQEDKEANLRAMFFYSIESYNKYLGLGLMKDAVRSLGCARDILMIALYKYKFDVSEYCIDQGKIVSLIKSIGDHIAYTREETSAIEEILNHSENDVSKGDILSISKLTDDEIISFAKSIQSAYSLPQSRLKNIVEEAKSVRYFEQEANIEKYQLLTDLEHLTSPNNCFANPSTYVIKNRITGIQSLASTDIKRLIEQFGASR